MRQPEVSASSTSRTPSTPTAPDSVGRPPRSAVRNSLSHRLSRLVSTPGAEAGALAASRADLPGVAIKGSVANFEHKRLTFALSEFRVRELCSRFGNDKPATPSVADRPKLGKRSASESGPYRELADETAGVASGFSESERRS